MTSVLQLTTGPELTAVLALKRTAGPQRSAVAWWLPFDTPLGWLSSIAAAGFADKQTRLYPLCEATSRQLAGLLVVPGAGQVAPEWPGVLPYGCLFGRLYLPVTSQVSPPLSDRDWTNLTTAETTAVWHPSLGLVLFERAQELYVADLIAVPDSHGQDWSFARPGILFPHRISQVLVKPLALDQVLGQVSSEIGAQPPNSLLTNSWQDQALGFVQSAVGVLLRPIDWLASKLALRSALQGSPSGRTPVAGATPVASRTAGVFSGLFMLFMIVVCYGIVLTVIMMAMLTGTFHWPTYLGILGVIALFFLFPGLLTRLGLTRPTIASQRATSGSQAAATAASGGLALAAFVKSLASWSQDLLSARQRALNRLMKMLETDPDEGLKYAIPMAGDLGRGIAAPGASLGMNSLDFSLSGGSGGPVDVWNLSDQTRIQLLNRYRELANRELQLGRHRRAAYIYAKLLGDFSSAASALMAGGFFREAAAIYREKLKHPRAAAEALVKGGLLHEAILIYRELGEHEIVGDLASRLGDEAEAREAYLAASQQALEKPDRIDAARLWHEKLHDVDRALQILDEGWSGSSQARLCWEKGFSIREKLGRTDEMLARINVLTERDSWTRKPTESVEVLGHLALNAAEPQIRDRATDLTRVVASSVLRETKASRKLITNVLVSLAPEDRLLQRDCQKAAQMMASTGEPANLPASSRSKTLRPVRELAMPAGYQWTAATTQRQAALYIAGFQPDALDDLCVVRWGAGDTSDTIFWRWIRSPILPLERVPNSALLVARTVAGLPLKPQHFPVTVHHAQREFASTPAWLRTVAGTLASDPEGLIWVCDLPELRLQVYRSDGTLMVEHRLPPFSDDPEDDPEIPSDEYRPVRLLALGTFALISVGRRLLELRTFNARAEWKTELRPRPIHNLVASSPLGGTQIRVAIVYDEGAELLSDGLAGQTRQPFATGITHPQVAFLADGTPVVSTDDRLEVYRTEQGVLAGVTTYQLEKPIDRMATLPGFARRELVLIPETGPLQIYDIPLRATHEHSMKPAP